MTRINKDGVETPALGDVRSQLIQERGPSTKESTTAWVDWGGLQSVIGQAFSNVALPVEKLYEMRRDPMLAFGLAYIKVPLIRAPWYIKCEDAQVAAFLDNALRRIYGPLILSFGNALDFGFAPIEKRFELTSGLGWTYEDPNATDQKLQQVWAEGPIKPLIWKAPNPIPPETVEPRWSTAGEFDGFTWNAKNLSGFRRLNDRDTEGDDVIPVDRALWFTNERWSVFGSLWGYPRIAYAHRYWWSYWFRWALADRAYEKHSDPAIAVYYPDEAVINDADGHAIAARSVAMQIGEAARSGSTLTIPNTRIEIDNEGKKGEREWSVEPLQTNAQFDAFAETFNYLDVMKLRSLMVPEKSLIEASGGGGYNVASEMGDLFYESQAVLMAEIDDHINRFMLPQLIAANFPERKVTAEKVTRGFAASDMSLAKQLVQLIGQAAPQMLGVDVREVLKQSGVPILSPEAVAKQQQDAQAAAEGQGGPGIQIDPSAPPGPPPAGPQGNPYAQGGTPDEQLNAGVALSEFGPLDADHGAGRFADVRNGRYQATRSKILLGPAGLKAHPIKGRFKGTPLDAPEFESIAEELYATWMAAFEEGYSAFASALESGTLSLAEDAPAAGGAGGAGGAAAAAAAAGDGDLIAKAELIVSQYGDVVVKAYGKASKKTKAAMQKLLGDSGKKAIEESGLDPVVWNMDNPDVVAWMREQGAALVRNVSETTRKELREFIAKELAKTQDAKGIAAAIRAKFADYPGWKAQRLARTETAHAYNASAILAARQFGAKWLQASDASGGRNHKTDAPCIHRNGKFYRVEDAPYADFHPNGTLAFRIVPPGIIPPEGDVLGPEKETVALYDDQTNQIQFSEDASVDAVSLFLVALCEHFGMEVV